MVYHSDLVADLGLILIAAALVILLFRKLKQPVVLGYLIAGVLVGPHVKVLPTVKDTDSIAVWAEIGVIFLLFGLGLEFSFKKLASVGKSAATTALVEILFMLGIGYLVGQILGWKTMDSLFLGGILSISSTTIIVRAFEEIGVKGQKFASLVFGILIVEDLLAILLLVLLSTVAATQSLSGFALIQSALRLGFFMVLWFLIGIYLLPIVLDKIHNWLDDETTLVVSLGLCLLMVTIATQVGFSPALGAFVMGSLLAETKEGKNIEHLLIPVKDLFAAVFFVSVGMLIDPGVLYDYFWTIFFITVITIVGKFISSGIGSLISGNNLKQSVQTGMSLAQIGEFSFIIATLGVTLKVTSDFLYPIAVAVSAVTTFTTPYLIKYSDTFYDWLEKGIPSTVVDRLKRYELTMAMKSQDSAFGLLLKEYGVKMLLNSVIIGAIAFCMNQFGLPWLIGLWPDLEGVKLFVCLATLFLSAPFLWAVLSGAPAHIKAVQPETLARLEHLQFGFSVFRFIIGVVLVAFVVAQFFEIQSFAGLILVLLGLVGILFSRHAEPLYRAIEKKFLFNLKESENNQVKAPTLMPELSPWQASLVPFILSANSDLVGKTLKEVGLKEIYGVMVTMIERGRQKILAPGRDEVLYPKDKIYLIGTDEQFSQVRARIEQPQPESETFRLETFGLDALYLPSDSQYLNQPIRTSGIREAVHGLIVGIERNGVRILNPHSEMSLHFGDLIWIVGDRSQIRKLKSRRMKVMKR